MKRRLVLLLLLACTAAHGAALTPREILEQSDRARGKGPGLAWNIAMTSEEGAEKKEQTLEVKARENDALVTFAAPARMKGQMMLMQGRNMWFIKPGVSKPIPISPRQKLMGQAANGDIASTNYAGDYDGKLLAEEQIGGEPCYVLDLAAKTQNLTYDRIVFWVSKERLVGVKADFYTVSGKKFKSAVLEHKNAITYKGQKYPFISKMVITDTLRPADITTMVFGSAVIKEVPDSTFNLNLLVK